MRKIGRYFKRVLLGLDQFGNTILGGYPDETISARAGRNAKRKGWRVLACFLNKIDNNHVYDAIRSEQTGSQQDPYYDEVYDPEDAVVIEVKVKK